MLDAQRTGRCVAFAHEQDGAAAWLLPRSAEVDLRESETIARFLAATLGPRGYQNYYRIVRFMSPLAKRDVPADAWYLSIVGIHPLAQGKGLGANLLRSTLEEVDGTRVVAYLETLSPRNSAFYERLGFRCIAQFDEPTTKATYAIMRREALAD
jgi:GNAT superfamily N-acetyltransferase